MKFFKDTPLKFWIISCCPILILLLSFFRPLNNYELISYDLRFKLRPAPDISDEVALIEVSDDALKNFGAWPLPRDFHAAMVDVLRECGVRAIVFDILFSEPAAYDAEFCRAVEQARNVYLPLAFYLDKKQKNGYPRTGSSSVLAGLVECLSKNAAGIGHINVDLDADGKLRKVPLFVEHNGDLIPQLGLKVACDRLGLNIKNISFRKDRLIIDERLWLPLVDNNSFLVNYPGKWAESFRHFSYFEILKSYAQRKEGKKPDLDLSQLKNKVCFIGLTATGTSDFQPAPLENNYPLLGLQASVFNSLVNKEFITYIGFPLNFFIALFIFAVSLAACLRFRPLKALLGSLIIGIIYFIVAVGIFIFFGIWADLFLPLLILLAVYVATTAYRFFAETKKRELLEKELEIARAIQQSFLPQELREFCGLDISSSMLPAKFVAGDLYDFIRIDDKKLGLLIGDVSGKGVPASLIMAQTISFFRIFARQHSDCAKVLGLMNKELCGRISARFITCMYIIIDTADNKVYVSSAGHSPLLFYRRKINRVSEIELDAGLPLGVSDEVEYDNVLFNLEEGDKIILFTDGLFEARNSDNQEFGIERVKMMISQEGIKKSEELLGSIANEVNKFSLRCGQHDDITLIIVGR